MNVTTRRAMLQMMAAGLALGAKSRAEQQASPGGIPTRPFGKTGERLTIIGLGGWDIGAVKDDAEAIAIMREAVDEGINFFDNCWEYHNGRSEELMGRALADGGRRDRVFLMTKVCGMMSRRDLLQDLAIARGFRPMTEAEVTDLLNRTGEFGADGHIELYKTADFGCTWSRKNPA